MGMSDKKQTTTSNSTTNATMTPTNPAWVESGLQGLGGQISDLSKLDPYSLIAGPDPLQTQASQTAGSFSGLPWDYNAATDIARGVANADPTKSIAKFQNPYENAVVNTTLSGFDQNANLTKAQDLLDLGQDTTFGGSGGALKQALTAGQLAQGRASTEAQLRNQGFNTAAGLSAQDQALKLQAANSIAGTANDYQANQRANVGMQGDLGAMLQQLAQQKAGAPVSLLGTQAGLYGSLPLNLLHGQNTNEVSNGKQTTTSSDPLGGLGSLALGAASIFGAPFTGGMSLGALGGLGSAFAGGGAAGGLMSGLGNLMHNDPTGMWSLGGG